MFLPPLTALKMLSVHTKKPHPKTSGRGLIIRKISDKPPSLINIGLPFCHISKSSLVRTIPSALEFHQISLRSRACSCKRNSPPVGNCTLPRRQLLNFYLIYYIMKIVKSQQFFIYKFSASAAAMRSKPHNLWYPVGRQFPPRQCAPAPARPAKLPPPAPKFPYSIRSARPHQSGQS